MKRTLLGASIIALIFATFAYYHFPKQLNYYWFGSIIFLIGSLFWPLKIRKPHLTNHTLIIIIIIGLALVIRLINLADLPAFVHGDEAEIGIGARDIMQGKYPHLFNTSTFFDVPVFSFAFPVPIFTIFGDTLYSLRLTSVFLSELSLVLTYMLANQLWRNKYTSLLSVALLSTMALHIHFSRSGTHYMQAVVLTLAVFLAFWKGVRTAKLKWYIITGLCMGLSLLVYYSARIVFVLVPVLLISQWIKDFSKAKKPYYWRKQLMVISALAVGILFSVLPQLLHYHSSLDTSVSRTKQVFIFTNTNTYSHNIDHLKQLYEVDTKLEIVYHQTLGTLGFFWGGADHSGQYAYSGGGFDKLTAILLLVGVFFSLYSINKPNSRFLLLWLGAMLMSMIFTVDAPFSPRFLPALPAIALLAANVLTRLKWPLIAMLLIIIMSLNIQMYFFDYPKQKSSDSHTVLAYYLAKADLSKKYCLLSNRSSVNYATSKFLAPKRNAQDISTIDPTCNVIISDFVQSEFRYQLPKSGYIAFEILKSSRRETFFEVWKKTN